MELLVRLPTTPVFLMNDLIVGRGDGDLVRSSSRDFYFAKRGDESCDVARVLIIFTSMDIFISVLIRRAKCICHGYSLIVYITARVRSPCLAHYSAGVRTN